MSRTYRQKPAEKTRRPRTQQERRQYRAAHDDESGFRPRPRRSPRLLRNYRQLQPVARETMRQHYGAYTLSRVILNTVG